MNKSAAIIIADGYTDCEFLVVYHYLKAEEFDVKVFSLNGGPVIGIQGWVHKTSNKIVDAFDLANDGLLILIGGVKAIEKLRQCKPLIEAIATTNKYYGIIASICHGGQLLIEADIVRDRKVLGYYSIKKDLQNAGAIWPDDAEVITDGNLCTSSHYDYSGVWIKAAVKMFKSRYGF